MTEMRWDVAPGDRPTIPASEQGASSGLLVYTIGLLLAVGRQRFQSNIRGIPFSSSAYSEGFPAL